MKVLKVIHGYPMRYNAGSEVYSQTLCHKLASKHEVQVFTREENTFKPDYAMQYENDHIDSRIKLNIINIPLEKHRYQYRIAEVDQQFVKVLQDFRPDIIHVGHLNHLSLSLVTTVPSSIPIIYTLHDYWLMCPRGQFIQRVPENIKEVWSVCDGQDNLKCALRCYSGYFSGANEDYFQDSEYWQGWIKRRMDYVKNIIARVDCFIAPSQFLLEKFKNEFGIPSKKLIYLDYGFDLARLRNRVRVPNEPFTFGYIGTHIPAKGIQLLITAFGRLKGAAKLRIWGRPRGESTGALKNIASSLPSDIFQRIEWLPEYGNQQIVTDVFNKVDVIVVPSIWYENSPLVIHEALQVRVPIITADVGGMSEYVHHNINGLLFKHRNIDSLTAAMQQLLDNPELAVNLGFRGYVQSSDGNIPCINQHLSAIENIYQEALREKWVIMKNKTEFWRITFDTNPHDCNLHCIMCEHHSRYSTVETQRILSGQPKRQMPIALIRSVLESMKGSSLREIIPSTMGEPLLYKDFEQIIALCKEFCVKLNLTTNGTFPVKGATAWAKIIVPLASDVKISWNGATKNTQEKIMEGADFEQGIQNIKDFLSVRNACAEAGGNYCQVTLQLTFMESNLDEIADIVKLGIDLGVDRIKGHHLWVNFPEIEALSLRRNSSSIARWNAVVVRAKKIADEYLLPNGRAIALVNFDVLDNSATHNLIPGGICPFVGQEAWIAADGSFSPCCAPDVLRRRLGDFGNVRDRGLLAIWHSEAYQKLMENYMNNDVCILCNMRRLPN